MTNELSAAEFDRWEELDAARLLFGLTDEEQAEYEALAARRPTDRASAFELTVARLDVAWSVADSTPLSADLQAKILARSRQESIGAATGPSDSVASATPLSLDRLGSPRTPDSFGSAVRRRLPWLATALSLALAIFFAARPPAVPPTVDAARAREALLAEARDVIQLAWSPGPTPVEGAAGDVVWSNARQEGYLRFRGLPVNLPTKEQYQLWIFDKNQSDKTPVDGGVFDITSTDEVVVPIDPKLNVRQAFLFAVTIEKPGGVVVSSRERLPLLAQVD